MSGIARVGDIGVGVCYWHKDPVTYTTVFATGAPTVTADGQVTAVVGTIGHASCGHATVALTGSPNVFAENQGVHRLGDVGQNGGQYVVVSASPTVNSN